ncbi:MAG: glucose 1-dehydrogenase [Spirochaetia bacterium]|jgi:NAD(P)-dependent dehydrogenase (short-subunit alcohol dehydrogenase family)
MPTSDLVKKARQVASLFDLRGKVAVVTGGAKGLGEAIALALAGAGADVAIAGKTQAHNRRVVDEIISMGRRSIAVEVDVREPAQVEKMVAAVVKELGGLDILVNSAGYADVKPIADFPIDTWETIMDINVKGTFLCAREAAKHMLRQGKGRIINISSLQGFAGRPGDPAYAASKAAVNLMTKSMACEWASRGICVNAIAPTWCWTDLTSPALSHKDFYERIRARVPAGRAGDREDLFGIAIFLSGDASAFVNGAIIPVDGGAIASDGFPPVPGD